MAARAHVRKRAQRGAPDLSTGAVDACLEFPTARSGAHDANDRVRATRATRCWGVEVWAESGWRSACKPRRCHCQHTVSQRPQTREQSCAGRPVRFRLLLLYSPGALLVLLLISLRWYKSKSLCHERALTTALLCVRRLEYEPLAPIGQASIVRSGSGFHLNPRPILLARNTRAWSPPQHSVAVWIVNPTV